MDRQYDFAALEALLKKRSFKALREALLELNEVDIAEFLGLLNGEEAVLAFRTLPKGVAADVFAELEPEMQQLIVAAATDAELAVIVEDLYVDDAVDMLEDMPANVVKRILKNATPEMRGLINQFLKYPEHSAGSIMTAEFTDLRPTMTVEQAIEHIRRTGEDRETVYTCYVVGPRRRLLGVVTVRSLLLARLIQHSGRQVDGRHVTSLLAPESAIPAGAAPGVKYLGKAPLAEQRHQPLCALALQFIVL